MSSAAPRRNDILWIPLLLLVTLATRLLVLFHPLLGNFASRQVPYAMAAVEYLRGASLWLPRTFDLVNGKPTFMVLDLPLISAAAALLFKALPFGIDACGRLVSCLATLGTAVLLWKWTSRQFGRRTGSLTLAAFALSPISILYGQSFQADALAMFCITAAVFFLDAWLEHRKPFDAVTAGVSFSLAVLMRIQAPYMLLPMAALVVTRKGWRGLLNPQLWLLLALSLAAPAIWYWHTYQAPLQYDNIIWSPRHQAEVHHFPHPLLFQSGFYLHLVKVFGFMLLNPAGALLLAVGIFSIPRHRFALFMAAALAAVLILVLALPRKIYDHNYYVLTWVPLAAILAGVGGDRLAGARKFSPVTKAGLLIAGLALSLGVIWKPLTVVPDNERNVIEVSSQIRERTPPGSKIIYHGGGAAFIYYSDRYGWNFSLTRSKLSVWLDQNIGGHQTEVQMSRMREAAQDPLTWIAYLHQYEGAAYFVSSDPAELHTRPSFEAALRARYPLVWESPEGLIFLLKRPS